MIDFQNKKIILTLIKHKQITPTYRGKNINSPDIKGIIEKFHNNKYAIGPRDVRNILTGQ